MTSSAALKRVRVAAENIVALATGPWGRGQFTGDPSRLAVQVRHENFAKHANAILDALAELEG